MNKLTLLAIFALIGCTLVLACGQGGDHDHDDDRRGGPGHGGPGHGGPSHGGGRPPRPPHHHNPDYFHVFTGTETINGVPPARRIYWMNYAMSTRFSAQGPCPRDGFGAVIVNRTTDTLLCATTGIRSTFDPTDHAEIRLIRECAALFQNTVGPGAGRNKSVWAELSLYTTGESCPMCMSATRWAGLGENIYATSINRLTELGFTQILISSLEVDKKSVDGNVVPATTLISFANTAYYDQYFGWQFNTTNPCPGGCVRNSVNTCVVPTPSV